MVEVVAALIRRGDSVLICKRPEGKAYAGRWEFAGGKVEPGESGEAALEREIFEELGARVRAGERLADAVSEDAEIHLTLYAAEVVGGEIRRLEHSALKWVSLEALKAYPLCPTDMRLVEELRAAKSGLEGRSNG